MCIGRRWLSRSTTTFLETTPRATSLLSARGECIRTSKQQTQAGAIYYGGSVKVEPRKAAAHLPQLIDLGVAESYPTVGPILEADGLTAVVAEAAQLAVAGACTVAMYPQPENGALRVAVATVVAENVFRAEGAAANDIVVTGGATAALEALVFAICNRGDALIVPTPLYPAFYIDIGMRAGVEIIPTELGQALNLQVLQQAARRAHETGKNLRGVLYTSPCNPRGTVHTREEAAAIEQFVVDNDLQLIYDAVYAGTAYDEEVAAAAVPRLAPEHQHKLHTIWGLSKDFGLSGWRVGVVHSHNPHLIEALEPQMRFAGPSRLALTCSLALLHDPPRARRCLRRAADALQGRMKAGRQGLLDAGVPAAALAGSTPGAGPLDLIDFGAVQTAESGPPLDEEALWERILQAGVHVVRGQACGVSRPGSMRVCWGAANSDEEAGEAGRRIAAAYLLERQMA